MEGPDYWKTLFGFGHYIVLEVNMPYRIVLMAILSIRQEKAPNRNSISNS